MLMHKGFQILFPTATHHHVAAFVHETGRQGFANAAGGSYDEYFFVGKGHYVTESERSGVIFVYCDEQRTQNRVVPWGV